MPRKAHWETVAILCFLGAPHVVIGVIFGLWLPQRMERRIAHLEALPVSSVSPFPPVGSLTLLEGRLGDRATPTTANLLIYDEYQRTVTEGEPDWELVTSQRPIVWVQNGSHWTKVEGHYRLEEPSTESETSDRRFAGMGLGDAVVVVGTVTESEDPPTVSADIISAGTKADYLAFLRANPGMPRWFGGIFLACGLFLWGLAMTVIWQPWRRQVDKPS